jgi:hypothetical protein
MIKSVTAIPPSELSAKKATESACPACGAYCCDSHLPQITRARLAVLHLIHLGIVGKSHLQPMKRAPYAGHQHFCLLSPFSRLYTDGVLVAIAHSACMTALLLEWQGQT